MRRYRMIALKLKSWTSPGLMAQSPSGILYYGRAPQNVGKYDPKYHEIVKEYGTLDEDDDEGWEAVEVQFAHDNPPRVGVCDSPGWLAPDGTFYPCQSWEHDSMAWFLYRYVYDKNPKTSASSCWVFTASNAADRLSRRIDNINAFLFTAVSATRFTVKLWATAR